MFDAALVTFFGGVVAFGCGAVSARNDPSFLGPPLIGLGLAGMYLGAALLFFWCVGRFTH